MGRTRTFDQHAVLTAAMHQFWQAGFDGTGIADLERATELHRSSLYHAFGSKQGLFLSAIGHYRDTVVQPRLAPLLSEHVAPHALNDYLTGLAHALGQASPTRGPYGCLLINTAGTPLATDPLVAAQITDYRELLVRALGRGLSASAPQLDAPTRALLAKSTTAQIIAAFALTRVSAPAAADTLLRAASLLETAAATEQSGAAV